MKYFGTNLATAGHYFWEIEGNRIWGNNLNFNYPFNPENLPHFGRSQTRTKGFVQFLKIDGYSILAIYGSCADKREGTKSVFFVNEDLTYREMMDKVLSIPVCVLILQKMPFSLSENYLNEKIR